MELDDVQKRALKWPLILSLVGAGFAITVILAGAWTRLMDAGLGCPDWPGCYGRLVVPPQGEALAHSPLIPLEPLKAWLEMIHRYMATGLGLLVLILVGFGLKLRRRASYPWRLSLGILGLVILQGAFGAYTVTLKLWPQVVTLHLLGGLGVMLSLLWLHLRLRRVAFSTDEKKPSGAPQPAFWWGAAAFLLLIQIALGGWTSSNYAGVACQGFPTCNGQWWPEQDWYEGFNLLQQIGPNYLYGQLHAPARTAIHLAHRLGALMLGLSLLLLALRYWSLRSLRPMLLALLATYFLQLTLGIANVLLALPLWLALMHTFGAILLVSTFTLSYWRMRTLADPSSPTNQITNKEWAHA
ncbi:heme A synthase [Pistricoccus aurantiacus]|uniref:Heme A synthase n=1 Tax=Pistricoccus aurantiacus TaxID=1883414 RepID=A0A5B8SUA9_9GAMM|nr:COX15/CtaA family protein [Pistricoccus aurantiacus]QEA39891.1 heme A synthase [Pistricoccus aurantiacus]